MKLENKIILVFLLIWSILVFQLWSWLKETYNYTIFYPGIALLILGLIFVIWSESKGRFKIFCELFTLLALNNFIDELFFDPRAFQLNEHIAAIVITLNFIYKWTTSKKKNSIN